MHRHEPSDSDAADRGSTSGPGSRVNLPWSSKGWYADSLRRARDPELEALTQAEGRGKVNPFGFYQSRPIDSVSGPAHNPYIAAVEGLILLPFSAWLITALWSIPWLAILLTVIFGGCGLLLVVISVRRIPAWHRARRVAKRYVAEHEMKLPIEMRFWS